MCMCGMAPPTANTCVREKRKRRGGEGMQRMQQVVPYGFGRIALYKASWRVLRTETDRQGWTMDNETAR